MDICNDISLNEFDLPIYVNKDSDYFDDLRKMFQKYNRKVSAIKSIDKKCKDNIKNNCKLIENAIVSYYNANFSDAENNINMVIAKYIDSPFIVAPLKDNYAFKGLSPVKLRRQTYSDAINKKYEQMSKEKNILYRARISEKKLEKIEMLHIPSNKRKYVQTQRFSMPGIPCFYFSTTTYGAWLELEMPELEKFQVSAFELPDDIKVLNLCQQQLFIDGATTNVETEENVRNLYDFLEIFPLVIASSYRVLENNRYFKSEYIISQLIMQAVKKRNIDGVAYLSKKIYDYYAYPQCVNLAILIPYNEKTKSLYWERINEVTLTEPFFINDISEEKYVKDKSFINKYYGEKPYSKIIIAETSLDYPEMKFSEFDDFLCSQKRDGVCV